MNYQPHSFKSTTYYRLSILNQQYNYSTDFLKHLLVFYLTFA
jgi:hypothetical protein